MARKDSNPLSMTELCEYFKDRNDRIFKGDDNKEGKKMLLDKRIAQRNSRPSLRLQLEPPTSEIDPLSGNSAPATPSPFSPCPPRLPRSRRPPFTPQSSSSSSSGCSCCLSPYDSSPRFERFLRSPSTTSTSGCSCSSPCYDSSPRPERLQHSPFAMHGKGHYATGCCCCHFFPVYRQTPTFCQSLPQNQPLSPCSTSSTSPLSPYSPREVLQTPVNHFALLGNSKMVPQPTANGCECCTNPQSPLRQQFRGRSRRCSFPVSPRPPSEDPYQPKTARSLPCSPKTTSGNIPQRYLAPQPPLLRKRRQMKNESLLRKPVKAELADCEDEEVVYQEL